jgi:hypothetical protein
MTSPGRPTNRNTVCQAPDRQSENRIKERERRAHDQAHLGVAEFEVPANRFNQQREDLAIQE